MLPPMFGMGGSEIIVILIVALLFLGPDKLPQAAKQISKGIRDIKKQSRSLQQQIESDEQIGGALRDIKSALRGEDAPVKPKALKPKKPKALPPGEENSINPPGAPPVADTNGEPAPELVPAVAAIEAPAAEALEEPEAPEAPAVRLPPEAGERDADAPPPSEDDDEALASLIKPAAGTVAKGSEPKHG
jgi:sec-independent protein translocase protein TatB